MKNSSTTYNNGSAALTPRFSFLSNIEWSKEIIFVVLGSLLLALILILTDGNFNIAFACIGLFMVFALTIYRLDWGFFIFFAAVMAFDQFYPTGHLEGHFITKEFQYFDNINTIKYLPKINAGIVTPMELHLMLLISMWLIIGIVKKNMGFNRVGAWGAALLLLGVIGGWLVYGTAKGGVFVNGLWETRAMGYMVLFIFFAPQVIQTKAHVKTLMWILILGLTFKSLHSTFLYVTVGNFSFHPIEAFTAHEDPIFILLVFGLLIGLIMFRGYKAQLIGILICLIPLILGFHVGQRRVAFAAGGATMAVFAMVLSKKDLWRFMRPLIPLGVVFLIYLAAFWNSNSSVGAVAQMIKSGFITEKGKISQKDFQSNMYREIENYDLAVTVRQNVLVGTGFGNKYLMPFKLPLLWTLGEYIPHNLILGMLAKMGAIGFLGLMFFFNAFAFYGAAIYPKLKDPYLKAVCIVALAAIINQIIVTYFDIQLTFTRNMVLLGILMGLLTRLKAIEDNEGNPSPQLRKVQ